MTKFQHLYPHIPKSTANLRRGQFWAIPLANGKYGAGCVVGEALKDGRKNTRLFVAGVLQWISDTPPTARSLCDVKIYRYGFLHVKSINECGSAIIGDADIKFPDAPTSAESLELATWGLRVPLVLCEQLLSKQTQ